MSGIYSKTSIILLLLFATGSWFSCNQKNGGSESETKNETINQMDQRVTLFPEIEQYLQSSLSESLQIAKERQKIIEGIAQYVSSKIEKDGKAQLTFICTHNSRRSHMGQVWAKAAATYFGFGEKLETYSGGTEATAFNPRAVKAVSDARMRIENPGGQNPHYLVHFSGEAPPLECFSKKYDDMFNPKSGFGAVMTCSDADANCPIVPGAEARFALTYEDPKEADNTSEEETRYAERSKQIASEMMWLMKLIAEDIKS
jgi:arsenate reductase